MEGLDMIWPKNLKVIFKTISAAVAGIFLWNQIAWAGDLIENTLERMNAEQSQTFAPAYLQNQQALHDGMISQKQAIEEAANLRYGTASATRVPNQTEPTIELKGPRGGSSPELTTATPPLTGEPATLTQDEAILSVTTGEGDIIHYRDGAIESIERPDGTILRNIALDADNNLIAAEITYADGTVQIVAAGKVSQIIKSDGTVYNYGPDELVQSVVYPDGATVTYSYLTDATGKITETTLTDAEKSVHYDAEGRLKKIIYNTGKTVEYDNGMLSKITEPDGKAYTYIKTAVPQGGGTEYVVSLNNISYAGVKYNFANNNIVSIELPGGGLISQFTLDDYGNIVSGTITYPDGTKIFVEDSRIVKIDNAVNKDIIYDYKAAADAVDVYKRYASYGNTLTGSPLHISEFKFDSKSPIKTFSSNIYYRAATTGDSIFFKYYNGVCAITIDHWDDETGQRTSDNIPVRAVLIANTSYILETRLEDNTLKIYLYKKGFAKGDPIYTMANVTWNPEISSSIKGGQLQVEAYDNLNVYRYQNQPGDPDPNLVFRQGLADIIDRSTLELSFSNPFPGGIFDSSGRISATYDFRETPYFDTIRYNQDGTLKENRNPAGYVVSYNDGLIANILDHGKNILYQYNISALGNIDALTIDREGIKRIYDKYGNLAQITNGDITLNLHDQKMAEIRKDNGTVIENATFDNNGNIISAKITNPDKTIAIYSGGVLTEIDQPDGSSFIYDAQGNITEYNKKGIVYHYTDIEEGGQIFTIAAIDASALAAITDDKEIIYQKYIVESGKKRLIQIMRKNGSMLDYTYISDQFGNLVSIKISEGQTLTTYDRNSNITEFRILETAEEPAIVSIYQYGRIRWVYKDTDRDGDVESSELIYSYEYEFDASGKEVTEIRDVKKGDIKRYKDGLLISITDANSIVTTYQYNPDNKILKSTISRSGKIINEYIYTYDGDLTTVEDIDKIKRTYDKDNKLRYLEEGGRFYVYTYTVDNTGKEYITQKLVKIEDSTGNISNYEDGNLVSIMKSDGSVIKDFIVVDRAITGYTVMRDDITYLIKNGAIVSSIKPDGTIVEYYPYGWIKSITLPDGKVTNYYYEFSKLQSAPLQNNDIVYVIMERGGIKYKYDKNGRLMQIAYLDDRTIKYTYDAKQSAVIDEIEVVENGMHYFYDSSNNLIRAIDDDIGEYVLNYTENRLVLLNDIAAYTYDDCGELKKEYLELLDEEKSIQLSPVNIPSLLLHFNGINGAVSSVDSSTRNRAITFYGNAHIDSVNQKFGSSSLRLDGSGDYITIQRASIDDSYPDVNDFRLAATSVTWDFWICPDGTQASQAPIWSQYITAGTGLVIDLYNGDTPHVTFQSSGTTQLDFKANKSIQANTWTHIALVKQKSNWAFYINGIKSGTAIASAEPPVGSELTIALGFDLLQYNTYGESLYFKGNIDEFKFFEDDMRTDNFETPNSEHPGPYEAHGSIMSKPISTVEAGIEYLHFDANMADNTNIIVKSRSGPTINTSFGWSSWVEATEDSVGYKINSQSNAYIQYKVEFLTSNNYNTPSIDLNPDHAIKFSLVRRSFDINASSGDMPLKDYLTLIPPNLPEAPTISDLAPNMTIIEKWHSDVQTGALPDNMIISSLSFKTDLLFKIILADNTVIKYFNNKPISLLKQDNTLINNIVLERYNTSVSNYRIESGALVSYQGAPDDTVTVSFTAATDQGDTHIFKDNVLVQIKHADGSTTDDPAPAGYSIDLLRLVKDSFAPDTITGEKIYRSSDISVNISRINNITYFIDNKIASTYHEGANGRFEFLMDYAYDEAGTLILVRLPSARDSVDSQINAAKQEIAREKADYLRNLAGQKGLAYQQIDAQVQPIREQINTERVRLQPMLYQEVQRQRFVGWWIFGWWETYTETIEVPEVRNALNQLDEQERQLNEEVAAAYAQLNDVIATAQNDMLADEASSLLQVANQENRFHAAIIKEEATPIILEYYRSILGRDPDDAETEYWLAKVSYNSKIDINELKNTLMTSAERQNSEAFAASIKSDIAAYINDYLNGSQEIRVSLLQSLGLTPQDVVSLDKKEVDDILAFLAGQNIHFGRSAFVSLGTILTNNGVTYNLQDLALKTILIDIFTGSLNNFSDDKLLELSMYALTKAASTYGVTLNNTKLNYDDLTQAFNTSGQVIAHLKNNHYVNITNITADGKVSYIEHNKGRNGYTWTVSKDDFINGWTGYAIVQTTSTKGTVPDTVLAKKISDDTAMRVKGSCLPFLIPIIMGIIGAITSVATAVVGVISGIVAGISAILGPIISGIGALISGVANFMVGIGTAVFNAISFVGTSLISGIGQIGSWLGGIGSAIFGGSGLGSVISSTGFALTQIGTALANTVVLTALSYGVTRGLDAIGINSPYITNFITGGIRGLMMGGGPIGFIVGGIQGIAMQGVNDLGAYLGIDPMLTNVISTTAGAFIGAVGNNISPITGQFNLEGFSASIGKQIMPNISSEIAYYGITKAGELLGVDPRISYLAGIGIRSSIQAGLSTNMNPTAIWNGVINGLLRGGTSIGLQWVYQELDMDPLLGSLSAAALTGAIEGLLEGQGVIKGVYDTLFKTGTGLLTLGGSGNNAWAQAAYISQVLDFSRIIQERGLVDALETYASGFLHQNAIDNIWKMGGIADLVTNKAEVVVNEEGATVKRVYINPERTDFIDFSLAMDDMVGYKQGNILVDCPIEIGPDGCPTTDNGKVKVLLGGKSRIVYNIKDHNLILIEYIDSKGETIAFAQPLEGEKSIKMNEDNNSIRTGRFYNREKQMIVDKRDNQVFRILSTPRSDMTDVEIQELTQNGVEGRYLDGVTIEYDKNSNQVKLEIDPNAQEIGEFEGKTTFLNLISVNGISNEFGKYTPPTYEQRLRYRLSSQGIDENAIYLLPMFDGEGLPLPVRVIKDMGLWLLDNAGTNILTGELIAKLDREIYGDILPGQQYEPKIMTLFSGSANSFFKAINKRHDYIIRDAIVLGGPTLDGMFEETTVTNPHLDRVFNIWGTKDMFYPMVSNKKYSSNVTPYNIEILGASHFDYFFDPAGSSLNARASYFVEELMKVIYNNGNIESFMAQHQASYNGQKKAYIVDPYKIDYNPELEWRNGE